MEESFNKKYRDYNRSKETKEEISRMNLGPNESMEDYEERANFTLDPGSLKLVPSLRDQGRCDRNP